MGGGASSRSTSVVLTAENLPRELFVEGAGSVRANGKFVLRTDKLSMKSPSSGKRDKVAAYNQTIWFSKDDDEGCRMVFMDHESVEGGGDLKPRKWVICTTHEMLYLAPIITGGKETLVPRQGRWDLGDGGTAPAPTVNLQRLPASFRLAGWKGRHDRLNGEYVPLDDGSKLLNQRPIFQHTPVVGILAHQEIWRTYWSRGAWRFWCMSDEEELQPDETQCVAFAESDATHPTAMPGEVVWKGTTCEDDGGGGTGGEGHFEVVDGVSLATGTSARVYISCADGDNLTSLTVRPWFDTVADLQAQAFATDIPSQRQQLRLDGNLLQDDGRVLAQHSVVAECTMQLLTLGKQELLDALFDESVGAIEVVGEPSPDNLQGAHMSGHYNPSDGRIYMAPRCATRAVRFDPATNTWERFGDTFPEGEFLTNDKWYKGAVSSIDNCMYCFPAILQQTHRVLKIDMVNGTAEEVGGDVRLYVPSELNGDWPYNVTVANADGIIFGVPNSANSVIRFDPRTNELRTFGQIDPMLYKYLGGIVDPSGRYIFCLPAMAARILCIDTQEETLEMIGPDFGRDHRGGNYMLASKWHLGAVGGDGCIYGVTWNSSRIVRIDPESMEVSLFGQSMHRLTSQHMHPWMALTTGMDGCLYGTPFFADRVLRIDPFAGTVCTVGEAIPADQLTRMMCGVTDKDGAIWMLPMHSPTRMLRVAPRPPQTALLTTLLQPEHHAVLQEGLRDACCYGPALMVALWREAARAGGDLALVSGLLAAAAKALPTVVAGSIKNENGHTAGMLLRTILAVLSSQGTSDNQLGKEEKLHRLGQQSIGVVKTDVLKKITPERKISKDCYTSLYEAVRVMVTDRDVLPLCFTSSTALRDMSLRMLHGVLSPQSLASTGPSSLSKREPIDLPKPLANETLTSAQQAIASHVEKEWPELTAALRAIRHAPAELSTNSRQRIGFLSNFTAARAVFRAPAPNAWQPLPASPDEWCWPPGPLIRLRAAAKLVQRLGPESVRAMWPVLAGAISKVLVRIVDAVRADIDHATYLLTTIFDHERKSSLETYQKQLRRARRDPTFPEFQAAANELDKRMSRLNRKDLRVQTSASFSELYATASAQHKRLNDFLAHLAQKCAGAEALQAPLKGISRALEKLVLQPGVDAKIRAEGIMAVDATTLVDVLRGSLECRDFTNIIFVLELLQMLDVELGDEKKAKAQGWDLKRFQIRIIHLKNRFTVPTSGGWADCMVNFSFAHGDDTHHVMELQIQHEQMLVVRKEGKAHNRYNSFRSAFELLETVGREPHDFFEENEDDLPPLQKLELRMKRQMHELKENMQQQIDNLKEENETLQRNQDKLKEENEALQRKQDEQQHQIDKLNQNNMFNV